MERRLRRPGARPVAARPFLHRRAVPTRCGHRGAALGQLRSPSADADPFRASGRRGAGQPPAAPDRPGRPTRPGSPAVHETRLKPGDHVLLYTDGVVETRDANKAEFGLDRHDHRSAAVRDRGSQTVREGAAGRGWRDRKSLASIAAATPSNEASTVSNATWPWPPGTTNSMSATRPPSTSPRSINGSPIGEGGMRPPSHRLRNIARTPEPCTSVWFPSRASAVGQGAVEKGQQAVPVALQCGGVEGVGVGHGEAVDGAGVGL